MVTVVTFWGIKRPEREFYHSPTSSAEVENEWSYTSNIYICLRFVNWNTTNVLPLQSGVTIRSIILMVGYANVDKSGNIRVTWDVLLYRRMSGTSSTTHPKTRRHIPEELHPRQQR
jgi:hypothetical protein